MVDNPNFQIEMKLAELLPDDDSYDGCQISSRNVVRCIFIIALALAVLFYLIVHVNQNGLTTNLFLPNISDNENNQFRAGVNLPKVNMSEYFLHRRQLKLTDGVDFLRRKLRIWTGEVKPEDLMTVGPFDFLPNYRNPCWRVDGDDNPPIKCLPYFFLAGMSKAGTTDLYHRIIQHPSVSNMSVKEPLWLDRSHYFPIRKSPVRPTFKEYLKLFQGSIKDVYRSKNKNDWHPKVFGDGSACTLWDNDYWELLPEFDYLAEPLYTNADYIHHLNPNTKIIVILRDPIERLYSEYLYFNRSPKKGPQDFHNLVLEAVEYFMKCVSRRTLRYCVYHKPPLNTRHVRVRAGIYFMHLKEFLRVFPRKQIHVVKLEEYSTNISTAMRDVYDFLKLEPMPQSKLEVISELKERNSRKPKDKTLGNMLPLTRKLLRDVYRPYNEELVKLLGQKFDYNRLDLKKRKFD